jgi:hypothetical protein
MEELPGRTRRRDKLGAWFRGHRRSDTGPGVRTPSPIPLATPSPIQPFAGSPPPYDSLYGPSVATPTTPAQSIQASGSISSGDNQADLSRVATPTASSPQIQAVAGSPSRNDLADTPCVATTSTPLQASQALASSLSRNDLADPSRPITVVDGESHASSRRPYASSAHKIMTQSRVI